MGGARAVGGARVPPGNRGSQKLLPRCERLTCTPAQVFDVDLLLLHARGLSDQTGVVVGAAVGGAHGVQVVAAAVDVADAPGGRLASAPCSSA